MTARTHIEEDPRVTPLHAFDLVLHIGAGADAKASPELARRFVFVEPDPEAAAALRARMSRVAGVEIVEAAVSAEATSATLHVFNVPGYASLRRATGLRRLFPGLETVRNVTVKTLTPAALLSGLDLPYDARMLLIVDAPGEETTILKSLLEAHDPAAFTEIRFHCGEIALYEGAEDAEAVCALLRRAGFKVGAPALLDDPDRPMRVARPDHAGTVAKVKADLAEARRMLAERDEALKTAQAQAATDAADLAKAREALAARDKTLAERDEALKGRESALTKAQGRVGDLVETNRRMEIDLRTMRRDLGLALRMQATLQAALDDLRERHAQISGAKEKQDDLLRQLTPRLREAALQLQSVPASSAADLSALSGPNLSSKISR